MVLQTNRLTDGPMGKINVDVFENNQDSYIYTIDL